MYLFFYSTFFFSHKLFLPIFALYTYTYARTRFSTFSSPPPLYPCEQQELTHDRTRCHLHAAFVLRRLARERDVSEEIRPWRAPGSPNDPSAAAKNRRDRAACVFGRWGFMRDPKYYFTIRDDRVVPHLVRPRTPDDVQRGGWGAGHWPDLVDIFF